MIPSAGTYAQKNNGPKYNVRLLDLIMLGIVEAHETYHAIEGFLIWRNTIKIAESDLKKEHSQCN